jgi:hypothetical protein
MFSFLATSGTLPSPTANVYSGHIRFSLVLRRRAPVGEASPAHGVLALRSGQSRGLSGRRSGGVGRSVCPRRWRGHGDEILAATYHRVTHVCFPTCAVVASSSPARAWPERAPAPRHGVSARARDGLDLSAGGIGAAHTPTPRPARSSDAGTRPAAASDPTTRPDPHPDTAAPTYEHSAVTDASH